MVNKACLPAIIRYITIIILYITFTSHHTIPCLTSTMPYLTIFVPVSVSVSVSVPVSVSHVPVFIIVFMCACVHVCMCLLCLCLLCVCVSCVSVPLAVPLAVLGLVCDLCGNKTSANFIEDLSSGDTICLGRDGQWSCGKVGPPASQPASSRFTPSSSLYHAASGLTIASSHSSIQPYTHNTILHTPQY